MSSVLEKRREYLELMRTLTLEKGYFTVNDIADIKKLPRSTVQDWVNRLIEEQCVAQREEKRGRHPARYAATSTMLTSACKRIFTVIDGEVVGIYHECMSGGCAAFCAYHHQQAAGALENVSRDGKLLLEYAKLGEGKADIGLYPASAVGVTGVRREGERIVQRIRCVGGPAYSLTDMIAMAEGVQEVKILQSGPIVEGEVYTQALTYVIVGIDDTDSKEGGATFALALGLLQHLGKMDGIIPIGHHVAMLHPGVRERTAGNSCSYIELAVDPDLLRFLPEKITRFVEDETESGEWGIAVKQGFLITHDLRRYGEAARQEIVTRHYAEQIAAQRGVKLYGGRGIIGALAAVALSGLENAILLDPRQPIPPEDEHETRA